MKHEIAVLWKLYDLLQPVMQELLKGLSKTPKASSERFTPEAKHLNKELCDLVKHTFGLRHRGSPDLLPMEYLLLVSGLFGRRDHDKGFVLYGIEYQIMFLIEALKQLENVMSGYKDKSEVRFAFRFCNALAGECRMVCVVPEPEEIVMNEVDIGAEIHVG